MNSSADLAADSIRVVCGPTAAGKSAIGIWLAERHGASIVSADSRQVYRGFDVGTAKPSADDRRRVSHYGIDMLDPTERYSAAAWAAGAERWMESSTKAGRMPLIVGGTGLYLRALFHPLFDEPELDAGRRDALAAELALMSLGELRRWCAALDPTRAHLGRTQLSRAVEIALLTGHPVSALHRARARPVRWTARYLLVDPGPSLAARIATRVDAMLAAGWVAEARRLSDSVPDSAPAWRATGYEVMRAVAMATERPERGRELAVIETRQYAKRQRTWFRNQLTGECVTKLDPDRADWREAVDRWWHGGTEE